MVEKDNGADMKESLERVLAVARLARLDLAEGLAPEQAQAALERFAQEFKDIVALMDTLEEVDTRGVEPLYWPLAVPPAGPRGDEAAKHNTRAELLAGAAEQDGRFFVVPRIV